MFSYINFSIVDTDACYSIIFCFSCAAIAVYKFIIL